jgi:hypothetical protein
MNMNRRSKEVRGYVNFPVDDPSWEYTGEGGMFVRLIVLEGNDYWRVCPGGLSYIFYDESLIVPKHELQPMHDDATEEDWLRRMASHNAYEKKFFPNLDMDRDNVGSEDTYLQYLSEPVLASVLLGSTGWSGFHEEKGYWTCTYDDLTDEGKALYDSLQTLYKGHELVLHTWLDT